MPNSRAKLLSPVSRAGCSSLRHSPPQLGSWRRETAEEDALTRARPAGSARRHPAKAGRALQVSHLQVFIPSRHSSFFYASSHLCSCRVHVSELQSEFRLLLIHSIVRSFHLIGSNRFEMCIVRWLKWLSLDLKCQNCHREFCGQIQSSESEQ